jgi:phosphatidylglycerol:prolipoprotein diacylglycerol transferase
MGQWLSLPMILIGIAMLVWAYRRAGSNGNDAKARAHA